MPSKTLVLIGDFYEGTDQAQMLGEVRTHAQAGVNMMGCAALDDTGVANYHVATAEQVVAAGMTVAAAS